MTEAAKTAPPFDQSTITDGPRVSFDGAEYTISWSSSSPDGTTFQLYVGRELVYAGTGTWYAISVIPDGAAVQVGVVDPWKPWEDHSAILPEAPAGGWPAPSGHAA